MLLAEVTLIDRLVFGAFLGSLVILGVVAAIVAFIYERKRGQHLDASREHMANYEERWSRQEERAGRQEERYVANIKRAEEHYDRVEKLLGEISEKLDQRGGS